jgi:hypothetical protein
MGAKRKKVSGSPQKARRGILTKPIKKALMKSFLKSKTEQLDAAMNLLERAANFIECREPDETWWREYYLLTGEHMVRTEEGWESGSIKQTTIDEYGADYILDEVNAPL